MIQDGLSSFHVWFQVGCETRHTTFQILNWLEAFRFQHKYNVNLHKAHSLLQQGPTSGHGVAGGNIRQHQGWQQESENPFAPPIFRKSCPRVCQFLGSSAALHSQSKRNLSLALCHPQFWRLPRTPWRLSVASGLPARSEEWLMAAWLHFWCPLWHRVCPSDMLVKDDLLSLVGEWVEFGPDFSVFPGGCPLFAGRCSGVNGNWSVSLCGWPGELRFLCWPRPGFQLAPACSSTSPHLERRQRLFFASFESSLPCGTWFVSPPANLIPEPLLLPAASLSSSQPANTCQPEASPHLSQLSPSSSNRRATAALEGTRIPASHIAVLLPARRLLLLSLTEQPQQVVGFLHR